MAQVESRQPLRSFVRAAVQDLGRLRRISNVLIRAGFKRSAEVAGFKGTEEGEDAVDVRTEPEVAAERLRRALEELGPTFVKVGQILSTRSDLVPPAFTRELEKLQDDAEPVAHDEIVAMVEEGLGKPINELFASFEPQPLASASMAQAHVATLHDGTEVVVKVRRPGIEETIRADLDLLHLFAHFLEVTIAEMELYAPADIVRALDGALSDELNFFVEAEHLRQMYEHFEGDNEFKIPKLYESHTSKTVLTLERIHGRSPRDLEPGSEEAKHVAELIAEGGYRMIVLFGHFHGDPHPGNLFVTDEGALAYIDFGLCGYLSPTQRDQIVSLVIAIVAGDVDTIARVLLRMGHPMERVRMHEFRAEVARVRERYIRLRLDQVDASAFLNEVMDAAQRYKIRLSSDWAVLTKTIATAEGLIRYLDPHFDLPAVGRTYSQRLLADRYSSERLMREALLGSMTAGNFLREVPDHMSQILMDIEAGRLKIQMESPELRHFARILNYQTTRLFVGICAAGAAIATPLFYANEPARWHGFPVFTSITGGFALLFLFWGLSWHLWGHRVDRKIRIRPLLNILNRR